MSSVHAVGVYSSRRARGRRILMVPISVRPFLIYTWWHTRWARIVAYFCISTCMHAIVLSHNYFVFSKQTSLNPRRKWYLLDHPNSTYPVYTDSESIRRACTLEIMRTTSWIIMDKMTIASVAAVVGELTEVVRVVAVLGDDIKSEGNPYICQNPDPIVSLLSYTVCNSLALERLSASQHIALAKWKVRDNISYLSYIWYVHGQIDRRHPEIFWRLLLTRSNRSGVIGLWQNERIQD